MIAQLRKVFVRDEGELALRRERGQRAEALMRDETLVLALDSIERVYMDAWRGSAGNDVELRERTFITVSLIADLRNQLKAFAIDGEAAAKQLQQQLKRAASLK